MTPESVPLTAFSTPWGQYEWLVMPFGIKQAPNIFQRRMDEIFSDLYDFCCVYIDDILVFSNDEKSHLQHLFLVAEKIIRHGLILGSKKVFFNKDKIDFLGHTFEKGNIQMQPHIGIKASEDFPDQITSKQQLASFIGEINYCREFIPKCSELLAPLYRKAKGNWKWYPSDTQYIKKLKQVLLKLPPHKLPEPGMEVIIATDASNEFWGCCVFCRWPTKSDEKVVKYLSGSFKDAELNYPTYQKETAAVYKSFRRLTMYLYTHKIIVRTDSSYFKTFGKSSLLNTNNQQRLIRWQLYIGQFDYEVDLIPGKKNIIPDALTRDMAGKMLKVSSLSEKDDSKLANKGKSLLCPESGSSQIRKTDYCPVQAVTTPEQTATGKEPSNPFIPDALGKSMKKQILIKGVSFPYFHYPVFKTHRKTMGQERLQLLNNLQRSYDTGDNDKFILAMKVLSQYFQEDSKTSKRIQKLLDDGIITDPKQIDQQELYLPNDDYSSKVPLFCMEQNDWLAFHSNLVKGFHPLDIKTKIICFAGLFPGHLVLDVLTHCKQEYKLWLFENGFLQNLYVTCIQDLDGFPPAIQRAYQLVYNCCNNPPFIRMNCVTAPPEWFDLLNGRQGLHMAFHYIRFFLNHARPRRHYLPQAGSLDGIDPQFFTPSVQHAHVLVKLQGIMDADADRMTLLSSSDRVTIVTPIRPTFHCDEMYLSIINGEPRPLTKLGSYFVKNPAFGPWITDTDTPRNDTPDDLRAPSQAPPPEHLAMATSFFLPIALLATVKPGIKELMLWLQPPLLLLLIMPVHSLALIKQPVLNA
ncbi:hypothetical protein SUGI_0670230 [Cryptomeria japonica]|nr:hypothetical protein SUGI_0670230 [Cryptomeria japonica]